MSPSRRQVIPLGQRCANQTYAQLSASFWQCALEQPSSSSPILGSAWHELSARPVGISVLLGRQVRWNRRRSNLHGPLGKGVVLPADRDHRCQYTAWFLQARIPDLGAIAVCAPESPAKLLADIKPIEDSATGLNARLDGQALS